MSTLYPTQELAQKFMRRTFRMQKFPENQGYTSYIYFIKDFCSMLLICLIFFDICLSLYTGLLCMIYLYYLNSFSMKERHILYFRFS